MYDFEFIKAETVDQAVAEVKSDEEAKYLGGGQTLLPTMKQRLAAPSKLVSLGSMGDLVGVRQDKGQLVIGSATPHADVAQQALEAFPGLASLAGRIGDPAVRNRGTIGGSLANNDPAACYPSAALACGATIVTDGREIAADDYFVGVFETALEEAELIKSVRFPIPEASIYQKFVQPASRFALVGVFVARFADRVGIAVTGASEDGVFRWEEAETALSADFAPQAIEGLSISAETMIEDLFGTKEYRAHLVPVLTARAVSEIASG